MSLFQKLLIILSIALTILIASMLVLINSRKTRDALRVADMTVVQNMLEIGFHDSAAYPLLPAQELQYGFLGEDGMSTLCLNNQGAVQFAASPSACTGRMLLSSVPRDPQHIGSPSGLPCTTNAGGACEYTYSVAADGSNYRVVFRLEGPTGTLQCAQYPCLKVLTKEGVR